MKTIHPFTQLDRGRGEQTDHKADGEREGVLDYILTWYEIMLACGVVSIRGITVFVLELLYL